MGVLTYSSQYTHLAGGIRVPELLLVPALSIDEKMLPSQLYIQRLPRFSQFKASKKISHVFTYFGNFSVVGWDQLRKNGPDGSAVQEGSAAIGVRSAPAACARLLYPAGGTIGKPVRQGNGIRKHEGAGRSISFGSPRWRSHLVYTA